MTNKDKNVLLGLITTEVDKIQAAYSGGGVYYEENVTWTVADGVASMNGTKSFVMLGPGMMAEIILFMSNYSKVYANNFAKANITGGTQVVKEDDIFKINSASFTLEY